MRIVNAVGMTQNRVDTFGADPSSLLPIGLNLCRLKLVSLIQSKNISKQNSRLAPPLHHETGADAKMDGWMVGWMLRAPVKFCQLTLLSGWCKFM